MKEIQDWLKSGQDYAQGVALYERVGKSRVILNALQRGASDFTRQKLREELSKLILAEVAPPARARARVVDTSAKRVDKTPAPVPVSPPAAEVASPAPVDEAVREQRSSWYAERHRLHATLELLATDAERQVAGERILVISELLTASYQGTGAPVAARAPRADLAGVGDQGEIRRLLANLRPQVSKLKKKPARALDLQQAQADIKLLESKLLKP